MDKKIQELAGKLEKVKYIVESLYVDDIENDIRNAERCLREEGRTLEIENIAKNRMYNAGANHVINDIREALGLDRLYLKGEKERIDEQIKLGSMGTRLGYDCPPLEESEYTETLANAKLIVLSEEADTYLVLDTNSPEKALGCIRKYERNNGLDSDEGVYNEYKKNPKSLPRVKVAWRKAFDEYEEDYKHIFSWSESDTIDNPKAVYAYLVRI